MASSTSTLSQTLQSITATKIEELEKQRATYEERKASLLDAANPKTETDRHSRISTLHDGVKDLNLAPTTNLEAIRRWLGQSKYDPSVPDTTLAKFEDQLRSTLDVHSRKLRLADLYSRLLIEWIESPKTGEDDVQSPSQEPGELGEDFDVVKNIQKENLHYMREKFEKMVFEPLETDEAEIEKYLSSLFPTDEDTEVLEKLRDGIEEAGEDLLAEKQPINRAELKKCIKSLLQNGLLHPEKAASLTDFLRDDTVLDEITDVLNMRYASLRTWSWNTGSSGIPVWPRQSLNGKWRVVMDEDILQAILTHWIGHKWVVRVKRELDEVMSNNRARAKGHALSETEKAKWKYFLGETRIGKMQNLEQYRQGVYQNNFFLAPMPSEEFEDAFAYEDEDDEDNESDRVPQDLSGRDMKQLLLRTLTTEMLVRRSQDGEAAIVQSDFHWFASGISHSTVFAVLRFVGFQEEWITFFKKVLEPPLDMLTGGPVRIRKRGVPMAHIFSRLFGELILFFMDLAVDREADLPLYRFHDDLWLCGQPDRCAKAWKAMETFASVMGLEFNQNKTGSAYIADETQKKNKETVKTLPEGPVKMDFLVLDADSGDWNVDKEHVLQHVKQLQKQLSDAKSILEWVKTWNSCIGRFFSYTFGEPANCFGRVHVDAVLEVHKQVQATLFSDDKGKSVTEQLSRMISERFDIHDLPDGFLYMPETLGGLSLRNPFVPLFLVSENLVATPQKELRKYHEQEREFYSEAKREFEQLSEYERRKGYHDCFPEYTSGDQDIPDWGDAQEFPSFEEYMKHSEIRSPFLLDTYISLVHSAHKKEMPLPQKIKDALRLDPLNSRGRRVGYTMVEMDAESRWLVNFYADELLEKCGSLRIVDKSFLPLGVLKAMRNRKVAWQMSL